MNRYFRKIWAILSVNVGENDATEGIDTLSRSLPVVWLLGKTAAGKSTLIRNLTGLSAAEIGNGFEACTRTSEMFDFPEGRPIMRFLDTRGLGEAGYDPSDDLMECEASSHLILAVARLDDPVQGELAETIAEVRKRSPATPIIVVHTGADLVPDAQASFRARSHTQAILEKAANSDLPFVEMMMQTEEASSSVEGIEELITLLEGTMPDVALLLAKEDLRNAERAKFSHSRAEVIWYASAAGASDIAPVVGAVAVPSIQAAMLHMLGRRYEVDWTQAHLAKFAAALGLGAALRFGASYAVRQAGKLIPVLGQTAGAAAAGTISFAATFALGRAAAFYLYRVQMGENIDSGELRNIYKDALKKAHHDRK